MHVHRRSTAISAGTQGELCECCGSERCSWQSCLWCCCRKGPRAEKSPKGKIKYPELPCHTIHSFASETRASEVGLALSSIIMHALGGMWLLYCVESCYMLTTVASYGRDTSIACRSWVKRQLNSRMMRKMYLEPQCGLNQSWYTEYWLACNALMDEREPS